MRSSAAFEGSLREVGLAKAEAPWDFGLLSSLPGELGRSRYQAVPFPYSRVAKVQPSSPWVCHWLLFAFLSCAQQCHQTEEQWGLLLQLLRMLWVCQSSEKGRKGCSDCYLPLSTLDQLCALHTVLLETSTTTLLNSFSFVFFNLRCELSFFPPWGKFSQTPKGKLTEKAMMAGRRVWFKTRCGKPAWSERSKELTGHDMEPYKSADLKSSRMDSAHQPFLPWHL